MTQRFLDAAKYVMSSINSANLSGAIDVIVVEQEDGSFVCSPFHVRFGKLGTLVAAGRPVDVLINGQPVPSLRMKLGRAGEAFFVEERVLEDGELAPGESDAGILTTPITSDLEDEASEAPKNRSIRRTQSLSEEVGGPPGMQEGGGSPEARWRRLRRAPGDEGEAAKSDGEEEEPLLTQLTTCKSDSILSSCHSDAPGEQVEQDSLTWEWGELPVEAQLASSFDRRASVGGRVEFGVGPSSASEGDSSDTVLRVSDDDKLKRRRARKKRPVEEEKAVARLEGEEPAVRTETASADKEEATEEKGRAGGEESDKEEDEAKGKEEAKAKEAKAAEGIYLSEIIDRPDLQELYVYGRSSDGLGTPASRDGAASPVDLGYRSDGEGSASVSPVPVSAGALAAFGAPAGGIEDDAYRIRNIKLSLCGGLAPEVTEAASAAAAGAAVGSEAGSGAGGETSGEVEGVDENSFHANIVLYEEFCQDPDSILKNPKLVVLLNGRYYNWTVAAPLLVSSLVYQCELPPKTVDRMVQKHMVKKEAKRRGSMFSRWTSWGRRPQPASHGKAVERLPPLDASDVKDVDAASSDEAPAVRSFPSDGAGPSGGAGGPAGRVFHVKSLRLPSERLRQLGLRPGANTIEYRVVSQFQGTARCNAQIFLWRWSDKLVISDIDGTITQSDVMGQLGPFLGRDVSQRGVAGLYSRIAANRFRLLYLSSRAIGQAHWTRSYLESVVQEHGARLPQGPLLLSPTSLLFALVREIRNRPEDFKIPCLKDVRSLFPDSNQPFFAGFGNKINDVRAYEAVGVPQGRIFVVNTEGDLRRHGLHHYRTSYSSLGDLVDHFFPETEPNQSGRAGDHESFSHFAFWREPPPELESERREVADESSA